jgi:competence protein ComEA
MPRSGRPALCCLAPLLSVLLLVKGRAPTVTGEGAAFFWAPAPGLVTVRLAGDLPRPGLYRFPDGTTAGSAIIMTLPGLRLPPGSEGLAGRRLLSGDLLTLSRRDGQTTVLAMDRMPAKERMLLGIPLDPDLLGPEEWADLPGIGPVLAARIVADRHKNGGFGGLEGVGRVPGLGPGKLAALRRYF